MPANESFTCPVCGYAKLDVNPYEQMPTISPEIYTLAPPYSQHWGMGSYEVCLCCGFEFGNDDEGMHPENNMSFAAYLERWVKEEGGEWFEPELKPKPWSLAAQLTRAGIPVPEFVRRDGQTGQ